MLLGQYIKDFKIIPADIEESIDPSMPIDDAVTELAVRKALSVTGKCRSTDIIIAADTVVVLDDMLYNKPLDAADAKRMLTELRGRTHRVITAVAVVTDGKVPIKFADSTEVSFRDYSDEIIDWYIATGEPLDRAGAYAVQEKGAVLAAKVNGDYNTVVGLPLAELIHRLSENGLFKFK